MSTLDEARSKIDQADLVMMDIIEVLRGLKEPKGANPITISMHIGGAPPRELATRLVKLVGLGLVERRPRPENRSSQTFMLTMMGAELLLTDVGNWQPARREQLRRDAEMMAAAGGAA